MSLSVSFCMFVFSFLCPVSLSFFSLCVSLSFSSVVYPPFLPFLFFLGFVISRVLDILLPTEVLYLLP